jgi:hypothetical protein
MNCHDGCRMTFNKPDLLRDELVLLLDLQLTALEKEGLGPVTTSEVLLYERRQERIAELCAQLFAGQAGLA